MAIQFSDPNKPVWDRNFGQRLIDVFAGDPKIISPIPGGDRYQRSFKERVEDLFFPGYRDIQKPDDEKRDIMRDISVPEVKGMEAPTAIPTAEPTPTPTQPAIPTPTPPTTKWDSTIQSVFGDQADNAGRVLKRTWQHNNKTYGENTMLKADASIDATNTDGTVDRGLFRINSRHFLPSELKRRKAKLDAAGISSFEDMLDPAKNIAMAKIIYDEQGWDAWVAAPESLLSEKEKERRREKGISILP